MKKMRKNVKFYSLFCLLCAALFCATGAFAEESVEQAEPTMVEIEYGGRIISVDMADLILVQDDEGKAKS